MSENPEPDSFADFVERVHTLAQQAKVYGISSLVVLHEDNPIAAETTTNVDWQGGLPLCIGLAKVAEARMTQRFLSEPDSEG